MAGSIPADSAGEELGHGLGKAERECGRAEEVRADRDAESARLGTHWERGPADAERDTEMMRMERLLPVSTKFI